jgi:phi13 family phage major tail protein
MPDNNKVLFGFSDLYVGTYAVNNGTVTLGTPYHQRGAVGFSPEPNESETTFYADNMAYFSEQIGRTRAGDLEVAKFDDDFKTQFLGYVATTDGGIAEVVNPTKPNVYIMFEVQGDKEARRVIMYNGTLGSVNREYSTTEEGREPVTESLASTFMGDEATGIITATYKPGDAGYDTLFTNPPVPAI